MHLTFFGEIRFAVSRFVRFRRSEGCNRVLHGPSRALRATVSRGHQNSGPHGFDGRGGGEAFSNCPRARRRVHAAKVRRSPGSLSRGRGVRRPGLRDERAACAHAGDGIGVRPFGSASDGGAPGRRGFGSRRPRDVGPQRPAAVRATERLVHGQEIGGACPTGRPGYAAPARRHSPDRK